MITINQPRSVRTKLKKKKYNKSGDEKGRCETFLSSFPSADRVDRFP
jgi:hypothetical protein